MRPDSLLDAKKKLRRWCLEQRKAFGQAVWEAASQAICAHIEQWRLFLDSEVILTYLPMRSEVNLRPLIARHPDKRWLVPRILPEEGHRMSLHPYDPAHLVRHAFGMDEPDASLPTVSPVEVQLVLVPALACDLQGWRLGYGGGYFDRFLRDFTGVSLGVVYQALLLESLPHADHDRAVDWIVTETGLFRAGARNFSFSAFDESAPDTI